MKNNSVSKTDESTNREKMAVGARFERLQEELIELGWLGFVKTLDLKGREMHAQLKLVDPDSEEARMYL